MAKMNYQRAAQRQRDAKQPDLDKAAQDYLRKYTKPKLSDRSIGIPGKVEAETDKAYLLSYNNEKNWVPKSYCKWEDGVMTMPYWIAASRRFVKPMG